jgi:hypothetical protein
MKNPNNRIGNRSRDLSQLVAQYPRDFSYIKPIVISDEHRVTNIKLKATDFFNFSHTNI